MPCSSPRWLAGFFVAFLAGHLPAVCQTPTPQAPVPPHVEEQTIEVERGGSVTIKLSAHRRASRQIRFQTRTLPSQGRLGLITPLDNEHASITYTHSGNAALKDEFRVAASGPGTGVSAPATISIRIIDQPGVLKAPDSIDFGKIREGEKARASLELQNSGSSPLTTVISIPAPWILEGNSNLSLAPGESASRWINSSSLAPGRYSGTLRYSVNPSAITELNIEVLARLEVDPSPIRWRWQPGATSPALTIKNLTEEFIKLEITAPPGLNLPSEMPIRPGSPATLQLLVTDSFNGVIEGEIVLRSTPSIVIVPLLLDFSARVIEATAESVPALSQAPGASSLRKPRVPPTPPRETLPQAAPVVTPTLVANSEPPAARNSMDYENILAEDSDLPPAAENIRVLDVRKHHIRLQWTQPDSLPQPDYALEVLWARTDAENNPEFYWHPLDDFRPEPHRGNWTAELTDLPANAYYKLRIVERLSDLFGPANMEAIQTRSSRRVPVPMLAAAILLAVVAAGYVWHRVHG